MGIVERVANFPDDIERTVNTDILFGIVKSAQAKRAQKEVITR